MNIILTICLFIMVVLFRYTSTTAPVISSGFGFSVVFPDHTHLLFLNTILFVI